MSTDKGPQYGGSEKRRDRRDSFVPFYVDHLISDTKSKLVNIGFSPEEIEEMDLESSIEDIYFKERDRGFDDETIEVEMRAILSGFIRRERRRRGFFPLEDITRMKENAKSVIKSYIPNPMDFVDIYPREEIEVDLRQVERVKEGFLRSEENREKNVYIKELTDAIEYIIADYLEGWFNFPEEKVDRYVSVTHTCDIDDLGIPNFPRYKKGFDYALEFIQYENEESDSVREYAGASIDVTTTEDPMILQKKLFPIVRMIKSNDVPIIKYFESVDESYKGKIEVAPYLLIIPQSFSREILANFYFNNKKELKEHPVQYSMLQQMKYQSEFFLALSRRYNNSELERKYRVILEHVNYIIAKKEKVFNEEIALGKDLTERFKGVSLITSALSRFS